MRPVEPVLLTRPTADRPGNVVIGSGSRKRYYEVDELTPGSGVFVLTRPYPRQTKCVTGLGDDPRHDTCDCVAFHRLGRCCHVAALRQLRDAGEL